ncbi:MAG: outer membrane protein assembly factor BamE [Bacteroidaceae bacterium]|nr:outer membrane protein assembly factor BamE [Bacteroidaceae bacterium]
MKRVLLVAFVALFMSQALISCVSTRSTSKISRIELGMTREDIRKLLGNPVYRHAWQDGEQWGYHKQVGEIAGPEQVLLVVSFDGNGRVAQLETMRDSPPIHSSRRH